MSTIQPIVYFAGAITVRGDASRHDVFAKIVSILQDNGAKVLTEHFALNNPNEKLAEFLGKAYVDLIPEDIEVQDTKWIDEATHVVAEITGASTGVGREIEYARSKHLYGKVPAKILCLYQEGLRVSWMITGMTPERYPNVTIRAYKDHDHISEIINEFFQN
jgi:hypothetical protein